MQSHRSQRLRDILKRAGLDHRFLEEHFSLSASTLRAYESGRRSLSEKGARRICAILLKHGWFCDPQWLLRGEGMVPFEYGSVPLTFDDDQLLKENLAIIKESTLFTKIYHNAVVLMITDDAMAPSYLPGHTVGGISLPNSLYYQAVGQACICEIDNWRGLRLIAHGDKPGAFNLMPQNPLSSADSIAFLNCIPSMIAPIIRHWWPLCI